MDETVNQAQGQIETQLQRRADLIPNLVETVKGVAKQEDTVFITIADARARLAGAVQSGDVQEMAAANQALTQGLGRLLAIVGELPELRSSENFLAAAGPAGRHREPHLRGPAGLQRRRGRLQRLYPPVSLQPDRQGCSGREAARVLRGGARVGGGAEGQVLERAKGEGGRGAARESPRSTGAAGLRSLFRPSPLLVQSVTTCSGSTYLSGSTGRPFTCTS